MDRKLCRGGLAVAACLIVTVAAACSSSSSTSGSAGPAASGAHGTLIVFGAGTLAAPFAAEIAAFKKANPGVTVHSQFAASGDMVRKITQLHQPADVLGKLDDRFEISVVQRADFHRVVRAILLACRVAEPGHADDHA